MAGVRKANRKDLTVFLLDEGATPQQVDKAIEKFGFAMGPFRMGDLAGNDIGWAIRKRRAQERPNMLYSRTADKLCDTNKMARPESRNDSILRIERS